MRAVSTGSRASITSPSRLGLRGLAAAEELDRWELRGLAHYRVGTALLFLGDHITAADHLRKSVATLDHEAGRTLLRFGGLVLAFIASFAAWTLAELGEFVEAETVGQMGFDLAVQANHAYSMSVASFGLSHAYASSRPHRRCNQHLGARLRANQTEQHRSSIRSGGKPTGLRIR